MAQPMTSGAMKVFLDDKRPCPAGWSYAQTPEEATRLLAHGHVTAISLDHDLGLFEEDRERTGYDVLLWIERQAHAPESPEIEEMLRHLEIRVHTANSAARKKMILARDSVLRRLGRA